MRRLDPAGSAPPPADAVRVPVRDPQRVPVGPGHPPRAHEVDQRVRLVAEYLQDTRHRPVAQGRVKRQVPRAELDHAGPADHRGLAEREQHQADSDSAAAPASDTLRILGRAQDRRQPLPDQAVLRRTKRFLCRGACAEVASVPSADVFLPRDLADAFSPLQREEPFHPARLRTPLVQRGQARSTLRRLPRPGRRPAASPGPPQSPGPPCAPRLRPA